MPSLTPSFWKEIGLSAAELADSAFLMGVGKFSTRVYQAVLKAAGQAHPPLDWVLPFHHVYRGEDRVLWWKPSNRDRTEYLPQVLLPGWPGTPEEAEVRVTLDPAGFSSSVSVEAGYEFYRRSADGGVKRMFNGENARLVDWCPETLTLRFQGCEYYDYLRTNLALDASRTPFPTLREQLTRGHRLEPLPQSELANATGINGLIFTSDGYMVVQRRRENVLVRPGELCSGFSGTVDRIDVANAVAAGGTLKSLDVPREMVEELGLQRGEIRQRAFLGITRELIRGGAPEMFYSLDLGVRASEVLSRVPQDREGTVHVVELGPYARTAVRPQDAGRLSEDFPRILTAIHKVGKGSISIPLLTNLLLWLQRACPGEVGAGPLPTAGA